MRKLQTLYPLAVLVVGLSSLANAQRPGMGQQPRLVLDALDLNHDRILSADEIKAAPQSLLTLDKNGDGQITANEVSPRPDNSAATNETAARLMEFDKDHKGYLVPSDLPERMRGVFDRGDANHDGKLTVEELKALGARQTGPEGPANRGGRPDAGPFRFDPLLTALDTNQDGRLDAAEIAAAATSLLTLDKNGDGQLTADEIKMRQMSPEERVKHMIEEFDTNKDGKISREEAPERMLSSQFDAMDKNHDGFVDKEELTVWFTQQAAQQATPQDGHAPAQH